MIPIHRLLLKMMSMIMLQKNYTVYMTEENPFGLMCQSLLSQIETDVKVIKIVFFGLAKIMKSI